MKKKGQNKRAVKREKRETALSDFSELPGYSCTCTRIERERWKERQKENK